jgi:hypothetical protein
MLNIDASLNNIKLKEHIMSTSYIEPNIKLGNVSMLATIRTLVQEGLLTNQEADDFVKNHSITYVRPSWIYGKFRKLWGDDDATVKFYCIKTGSENDSIDDL